MLLKVIGILIGVLVVCFIALRVVVSLLLPREFDKSEVDLSKGPSGISACAQVVTVACYEGNPFLCDVFSTPCDVPDNWRAPGY